MNDRNSVAIIGSRDVTREAARSLFAQHLSSLLHEGRTWFLGGTRGIDQWALEWLLEEHESCWAVVPYTLAHAPRWLRPWLDEVDRVVELQLPRRKSAHAYRNRYLVDCCEIVIGFRTGKGGGTFSTLRYALRKQKEVHAIPVLLKTTSVTDDISASAAR
jgi:predicted Rossmann fold nucleotide-binding protein DprA/Smf involved in DNA uptake